ncbi:MAG: hypothetical protein M1835_001991, partial [Candelina submexicana]
MHLSLVAAVAILSFTIAEPIPVHRPDLIRARCANGTEPPYGYHTKPESIYSTAHSNLLSATGSSSKSEGPYGYSHTVSSTSVFVGPTRTGPKYPTITSPGSGYRNSSSSSALVGATGLNIDGTSPLLRSTGYLTGGYTYSRLSSNTGTAGPTGTGSSYSSSANTSVGYPYSSAGTGISASSSNTKSSSSAIYPTNKTLTTSTGITVGPTAATSSSSASSTATPGRCPHDNVLRTLLHHSNSASYFCPRYLRPRGSYGPVIIRPVYLYAFPASRISTACSCFTAGLTTGLTTTVRATSTFVTTLTTSGSAFETSTSVLASPVQTAVSNSTLPSTTETATETYGTETKTFIDTYVADTTTLAIASPVSTSSLSATSNKTGLNGYGYGYGSSPAANASTITVSKPSDYATETTSKAYISDDSTSSVIASAVTASSSSSTISYGTALTNHGSASGDGSSVTGGPTRTSSSNSYASAS